MLLCGVIVGLLALFAPRGTASEGYELVKRSVECGGANLSYLWEWSLDDCAKACKSQSTMFAYGKNNDSDSHYHRCKEGRCACLCETATDNGTCQQKRHPGYNLYRYKDPLRETAASYELVKTSTECGGANLSYLWEPSFDDCAKACRSQSTMFAYGNNDDSNSHYHRCKHGRCACLCETATDDGTCQQKRHPGYNLYRYKDPCAKVEIYSLEQGITGKIPISDSTGVLHATGEANNCDGVGILAETVVLSASVALTKDNTYTFDKSWGESFGVTTTAGLSISMTKGFGVGGGIVPVSGNLETTAEVSLEVAVASAFETSTTEGKSISNSSTSEFVTESTTKVTLQEGEMAEISKRFKRISYETNFEAKAKCLDEKGRTIEEDISVTGKYKGTTVITESKTTNTRKSCRSDGCEDHLMRNEINGSLENWYAERAGWDCDWFGGNPTDRCSRKGSNNGMTAQDACCACGGGTGTDTLNFIDESSRNYAHEFFTDQEVQDMMSQVARGENLRVTCFDLFFRVQRDNSQSLSTFKILRLDTMEVLSIDMLGSDTNEQWWTTGDDCTTIKCYDYEQSKPRGNKGYCPEGFYNGTTPVEVPFLLISVDMQPGNSKRNKWSLIGKPQYYEKTSTCASYNPSFFGEDFLCHDVGAWDATKADRPCSNEFQCVVMCCTA